MARAKCPATVSNASRPGGRLYNASELRTGRHANDLCKLLPAVVCIVTMCLLNVQGDNVFLFVCALRGQRPMRVTLTERVPWTVSARQPGYLPTRGGTACAALG